MEDLKDFQRDTAAHRVPGEREPRWREGERLLRHPAERVRISVSCNDHFRPAGQGIALRRPDRVVAQQARDEQQGARGHRGYSSDRV